MAERPEISEIQRRLSDLSCRLGLMDLDQDWGISNSDGERLEEFVEEYRQARGRIERSALAELVLASADERLRLVAGADLRDVEALLPAIAEDAAWELQYWRGLEGDHFPLALWLRERL